MARYRRPLSATFIAALSLCVAAPSRGADVCQTIAGATNKVWSIPVHIYTTMTGPGAKNSESIYTGGPNAAIYVMLNGRWRRSPLTAAQMKSQADARDKSGQTCQYVRDEAVGGEAAAVYTTHADTEDVKADSTIWISKSRNVPLKSESDVDVADGGGKSHTLIRYDYSNVQAPSGVK